VHQDLALDKGDSENSKYSLLSTNLAKAEGKKIKHEQTNVSRGERGLDKEGCKL
jgi:hypothetical protein